jgi:hypothetical protein
MRQAALLLAILFAASVPTVADAAKAKRVQPVAAKQADPNAAGKLVLTEGLPGLVMPVALQPLWFSYKNQQAKPAAAPKRKRAAR